MNVDIPIAEQRTLLVRRDPKFHGMRLGPAQSDLCAFADDFAEFTGEL